MSDTDSAQEHVRTCLRFAADCQKSADDALEPLLRDRFHQMACVWAKMAGEPRVLH